MPTAKKKASAKPIIKPRRVRRDTVDAIVGIGIEELVQELKDYPCTPETENYRQACQTKLQEALVMFQNVRLK